MQRVTSIFRVKVFATLLGVVFLAGGYPSMALSQGAQVQKESVAPKATAASVSKSPQGSAQTVLKNNSSRSLPDVIAPLLPAVVNISTMTEIQMPQRMDIPNLPHGSPMEEFLRRFLEEKGRPRKSSSLGSGFVISQENGKALIVTCNHVIANADKIKVIFHDDEEYDAEVLGRDRRTDLALLSIKAKKKLTTVQWANSKKARVGETVVAIGNPFGLGGTATRGIISAIARDISARTQRLGGADYIPGYIQMDASINMGNSGGPMFNMDGQVLGINTAIFSPNGGNIGIGFAIPSDIAKAVIQQLKEHGRTIRGWLGVQIQPITEEIASSLGLKEEKGALVGDISKLSPAIKAGVKEGDVILRFDGKEVEKSSQLPRLVGETKVGSKVPMIVWRNGKEVKLMVPIGEFEKAEEEGLIRTGADKTKKAPKKSLILGMSLRALSPILCDKLNLKETTKGVIVDYVDPLGPAAERHLRKDDIILKAIFGSRQVTISTPEQLNKFVRESRKKNKKAILVLVQRGGMKHFITLPLDEKKDKSKIQLRLE